MSFPIVATGPRRSGVSRLFVASQREKKDAVLRDQQLREGDDGTMEAGARVAVGLERRGLGALGALGVGRGGGLKMLTR